MLRPDRGPHQGSTRQIAVVAAVVRRDGRLLVAQRAAHKRHGGLWEFPGGKVEQDETHLDAVRRELLEELGMNVTGVGDHLVSFSDPGSPFVIEFVEVFATGEPIPVEHQAVKWVAPTSTRGLDFAPADARFISWIRRAAK